MVEQEGRIARAAATEAETLAELERVRHELEQALLAGAEARDALCVWTRLDDLA